MPTASARLAGVRTTWAATAMLGPRSGAGRDLPVVIAQSPTRCGSLMAAERRLVVLGDRLVVLGDRLVVLGDRLVVLGDRLVVLVVNEH